MNSLAVKYNRYWQKAHIPPFFSYSRNKVLPYFFKPNSHLKVLDIGCGTGQVATYLQKLGYKVIGIDISSVAISLAIKHGVEAYLVKAEDRFPFKASTFDLVFWGDNIEHLLDAGSCLNQIKRVLKPYGKVVLSCPNMAYWRYRLYYLLVGQLPRTEESHNEPWAWEHIRFYNMTILKHLLKANSFFLTKTIGTSNYWLENFLSRYFPNFFAMILVIEARKQ